MLSEQLYRNNRGIAGARFAVFMLRFCVSRLPGICASPASSLVLTTLCLIGHILHALLDTALREWAKTRVWFIHAHVVWGSQYTHMYNSATRTTHTCTTDKLCMKLSNYSRSLNLTYVHTYIGTIVE
jgi:hypothetical protein